MNRFTTGNLKKVCLALVAFLLMSVAVAMVAGSGTATAKTALAANCDVVIYEYGHNAPGTDTDAKRNYEFIRLVNTGAAEVNVQGWWVQDNYPHTYKLEGKNLPENSPFRQPGPDTVLNSSDDLFVMPKGSSVYLYNGTGTDTQPTNNSAAIYRNTIHHFNNAGDTLSLRSSSGVKSYVQYTSYREKIGPLSCS